MKNNDANNGGRTMKTTRTMTTAQMAWNLKKGFAWEESEDQHWTLPIWTKDGGWMWDTAKQCYELLIV